MVAPPSSGHTCGVADAGRRGGGICITTPSMISFFFFPHTVTSVGDDFDESAPNSNDCEKWQNISGAAYHMTRRNEFMSDCRSASDAERVAGGQPLGMDGEGSLDLNFRCEQENVAVALQDVVDTPQLRLSFCSLKATNQTKGLHVSRLWRCWLCGKIVRFPDDVEHRASSCGSLSWQ